MMREYKWKELCIKDKILYVCAVGLIVAGVVLAFLSFALIHAIATGSLIFISLCFITAGGIFGVSIYFKSKLGEFSSDTADKIQRMIERALNNHLKEHH